MDDENITLQLFVLHVHLALGLDETSMWHASYALEYIKSETINFLKSLELM